MEVSGSSLPHFVDHLTPQDYQSMVSLVEKLPQGHEVTQKAPIQYHYAFALNRRNKDGDRGKALDVLEKVCVCVFVCVCVCVCVYVCVCVCVCIRVCMLTVKSNVLFSPVRSGPVWSC